MVPGAERGFLVRELDPRKPSEARIRQVSLRLSLSPPLSVMSPAVVLACLISLNTVAPAWPVDPPSLSNPDCFSAIHSGLSDQKQMSASPTQLYLHSLALLGQSGPCPLAEQ